MNQETENRNRFSEFLPTDSGKTIPNPVEVPSVNLPKGGGAIRGIDEKFTTNAVNGTCQFSIDLPFSPARGTSPALSLIYNSGAGNGVFGLGWALNLPSIKRRTEKELPQYLDDCDSDTYLFSAAEDLVPEFKKDISGSLISDGQGGYLINERDSADGLFAIRTYRPRIEGLLFRIERWTHKNKPETKWRVISGENVTTLYGWSPASRVSDPADEQKIFEWLPEFVFDDQGNCIQYLYQPENEQGFDAARLCNRNRLQDGKITYTNLYLHTVLYGNKVPYRQFGDSFPAESAYLFKTVFDYGESADLEPPQMPLTWTFRNDPFSFYKAGFEIRTTRLCRRVLLYHLFAELPGGSALVKSLDLQYENTSPGEITFLQAITASGYIKQPDGTYSRKSLPPLEFAYQKPEWNDQAAVMTSEQLTQAPSGLAESRYHFVDLFNEGLSGILSEQASGWYYKPNLGQGRFAPAQRVAPRPSFSGLGTATQLLDLDADGSKQLVSFSEGADGFFDLSEGEEWQAFRTFQHLPNIDRQNTKLRLLDLNGDGRPELLLAEDNVFTWYESEGKAGYKSGRRRMEILDEEAAPRVVFSEARQTIFLADMSGDGLTDLVRIRNGEVCYWPNLGHGRFGRKISMDGAPYFDSPDQFDSSRLYLADLDGTGTTDLIYQSRTGVSCWINENGDAFAREPFRIDSLPTSSSQTRFAVADLLGSGLPCLVWSSPLAKDAGAPLHYIDLMNSRKPHLLVGYKNNLGKEVSLEYTPSTRFYIEDKLAGTPWLTKLHFPVHCLTKTEMRDRVSGWRFVSAYRYRHGYYDHVEREFRGFGQVEQTDTESFEHWVKGDAGNVVDRELYQAPALRKYWYNTGALVNREGLSNQFAGEYWYAEMARQGFSIIHPEMTLPDADLVTAPGLRNNLLDHLSMDERQEAYRACKGMKLREEVFAQDAPLIDPSPIQRQKELTPYQVSSQSWMIELLQPKGQNRHAVFVVKVREAVTYSYERNAEDPRTAHCLNLKIDEYGNVLEQATVVYPRRFADPALPQAARQAQGIPAVFYTENRFTNDVVALDQFRRRLPSESRTYVLRGAAKAGPYYDRSDFEQILTAAEETVYDETASEPSPGVVQKRLIKHTATTYYNPDLTGSLPLHQLAAHGLKYESCQLAYTQELLDDVFGERVTAELMSEGGFTRHEGDAGWWVRTGTTQYLERETGETAAAAQSRFYTPVGYTDPLGSTTRVRYDENYIFIQQTEDALGNKSEVDLFNYRTLSPQRLKDANHNFSEVLMDELGLVKAAAVYGKGAEADDLSGLAEHTPAAEQSLADDFFNAPSSAELVSAGKNLLRHATVRYVYALDCYQKTGKPAAVASIRRKEHFQKNSGAPVQISFVYTNGLGQVVLEKNQAEPGPAKAITVNPDSTYTVTEEDTSNWEPKQLRWIGSGKKVLNNKGRVVKEYEPYFSINHHFEDLPELVENGVTPLFYYDPLGRLYKTEFPDGTHAKTEFDAWKQHVYDQNDTVLESAWYRERVNRLIDAALLEAGKNPEREKRAAEQAAEHANTPVTRHFNPGGRPILSMDHNKHPLTGADEFYLTQAVLDPEGNLRSVTDARGIRAMRYKYDLLGNPVYQNSPDTGQRWKLANVLGKPLRTWDERGHEFRFQFDLLHRPVQSKVKGGDGEAALDHVFERVCYGETEPEPELKNLRGKVFRRYDTGGMIETPAYDFKGLPNSTARQLFNGYRTLVNWTDARLESDLEPERYTFQTETDALGRITRQTTPDGRTIVFSYNETGLLQQETVEHAGIMDPGIGIKNIDYNEKGQRCNIVYGNGVTTNLYYDRETFRLNRLESKKPGGETLQDLGYTFDPVGNVTHTEDRCIPTVFFNNQKVMGLSAYRYDALYRLTEASGRESSAAIPSSRQDNWNDAPCLHRLHPNDPVALRNYIQSCQYDAVGNLLQLKHQAAGGDWTRDYDYSAESNRLVSTQSGSDNYTYSHHAQHGFMTAMPHLEEIVWNFKEEIAKTVRQRRTDGGTPETTYYQYDGQGQRLRKITENQASQGVTPTKKEERIYLAGYEIYKKHSGQDAGLERVSLCLLEQQHRFAVIETRNEVDDGTERQLVRYQLYNHLGSVSLELDGTSEARVISYEEYHPFGTTAYQANNNAVRAAAKRYRYTGKERDEESGLYYHGARYYACWLGRWISADPAGLASGVNPYAYVSNNPNRYIDPNGLEELEVVSRTVTQAGDRTFYHVIDWGGRSLEGEGFSIVGNQMANIQQEGLYAGGGKYGQGAYAFATEAEAQGLAGSRRPFAAFRLDPQTEVEEILLRGESGRTTTYIRIQSQSGGSFVRTTSLEFRNVSGEQLATYESAIESEGLAAVRTTLSAEAQAARAAPAAPRPAPAEPAPAVATRPTAVRPAATRPVAPRPAAAAASAAARPAAAARTSGGSSGLSGSILQAGAVAYFMYRAHTADTSAERRDAQNAAVLSMLGPTGLAVPVLMELSPYLEPVVEPVAREMAERAVESGASAPPRDPIGEAAWWLQSFGMPTTWSMGIFP